MLFYFLLVSERLKILMTVLDSNEGYISECVIRGPTFLNFPNFSWYSINSIQLVIHVLVFKKDNITFTFEITLITICIDILIVRIPLLQYADNSLGIVIKLLRLLSYIIILCLVTAFCLGFCTICLVFICFLSVTSCSHLKSH